MVYADGALHHLGFEGVAELQGGEGLGEGHCTVAVPQGGGVQQFVYVGVEFFFLQLGLGGELLKYLQGFH